MKNYKPTAIVLLLMMVSIFYACQQGDTRMKEGRWRGEFVLPEYKIPFVFEVTGNNKDLPVAYLLNGAEKFPLKNITYRNDSVILPVDLYDAVLSGKLTGNTLTGKFRKLNSEPPGSGITFIAVAGDAPRFSGNDEQMVSKLDGTWDIRIGAEDQTDATVGIFEQKESEITGSILTTTGDFRYLEGVVHGNKFQLSAFSGSSPYLVQGQFTSDSTFTGEFVTARKSSKMEGKRNPKAALADPYSFSKMKEGYSKIEFSFPNLEKIPISLADSKYKGKVVIVSVLGSWCPNCMDETAFLAPWYKENKDRGIEIIGLAFERKNDFDFAKRTLTRLKERFDIQYELLFAGLAGTDQASKALPALSGIAAFPSTIFIDKKGNVRKIHTGFSGPATGKFYQEFKDEFNGFVNELVAEK